MQALSTRQLVEGALLAAAAALLGLLSFYSGFGWLQPIPLLLVYLRQGARGAVLATVVASCVLGLWIGPVPAAGTLGFVSALGLVPGWTVRRGWGALPTILLMGLALLVVTALGMAAAELIWQQHLWREVWNGFVRIAHAHSALLARVGISPSALLQSVRLLLPDAAAAAATGEAAAVYGTAAAVLRRVGQPLPPLQPFSEWRAPCRLIWLYPLALGLETAGGRIGDKVLTGLAWNLLLAIGLVHVLTGLAAVFNRLSRRSPGGRPRCVSGPARES